METIIEVKSLKKVFGNDVALEDVSFQVKRGETFGFLGPSGSGKTTTIKILTGQLSPTSGEAYVFNRSSASFKTAHFRRNFGVLTDNSGLYDRLSIYDNLKLYSGLYGVDHQRIREVLEMVNLEKEQTKVIAKLSKGMKQRVLLARAFLHEPKLLFLDEPTSALDPANAKHIHNGLKALNERGTTIFLTTHDMYEAETLCNRIAFLHRGKIQLLDQPKSLRRQFSNANMMIELKNGRELLIPTGPQSADTVYKYMVADEIISIHTDEPTLGDIFLEVTGRELV
ncbi:MAG TPA: ABC transporter ATP-binding protein [Bacillota bacterium]|nr:ABC transporter ATP-binding protein [Bacillota bacterium]